LNSKKAVLHRAVFKFLIRSFGVEFPEALPRKYPDGRGKSPQWGLSGLALGWFI